MACKGGSKKGGKGKPGKTGRFIGCNEDHETCF